MKRNLFLLLAGLAFLTATSARAQWLTQRLALQAGWNAVFLHVDATHASLHELVGAAAPVPTPIEQVWRWNATRASSAQFILSPQEPVDTGTQWTSWRREASETSALQRLTANTAYLVYASTAYTWELKGRPVLPTYYWSTSGLNFFGFPTVPASPPVFDTFFADAPHLLAGEIFRYTGGEFGPGNPARVFALRTTPVTRGEAFWLRAGTAFNDYFGPFAVVAGGSGRVDFGETLSTFSFRLRNLTTAPLTVNLTLRASEAPPAGQPALVGVTPLLLRGPRNPTNLTYGYFPLLPDTPRALTLAARGQTGDEQEVVIGLDRARITAAVGDLLAGILELTDGLGHTRMDLGVTARVASLAGLWVGDAAVTGVSQYLQQYLRDGTGQVVVGADGRYVITDVVTNITSVPAPFPLRLIVHNPASGPATLLQRVYVGFNAATNPVVATGEAALARGQLADARRLSAAHLPWSAANPGWTFSGPLTRTEVITASVTNRYDAHESNPFLHTYHPDHDNLDPTFKAALPPGAESYTIVRDITLRPLPPGEDFLSRVQAGLSLVGEYFETIRVLGLVRGGGPDTRRFDVRGAFELNRIAEVPNLTRVP